MNTTFSFGSSHGNASNWFRLLSLASAALLCQACPNNPQCGDGYVDVAEVCDDGNPYDGDGCSAQCQLEAGYQCPTSGVACEGEVTPVCGDGIVTASEECDDGSENTLGYNTCAPDCTLGAFCGDGVVDAAYEECDDGVNSGDSGCTPWCTRL